ncbi:MAG: M20/M25/M40 family metallo-hydrolase, partial [Alphaproteobacteria bacterium]|nr:M20/M25/M40 family metallo-hydrolase [Alphaproteobacteria bacterium]
MDIIDGDVAGKASLWARLGPAVDGGIVFSGHIDVVPVDNQAWSKPPFAMTVENDRFYGRGACDMKGFVACVLSVVASVDASKLTKPIYIALTYNEEVNMAGAKHLVSWLHDKKVRPDWVWVGEPTELNGVTAHKGTGN